MSTSAFRIDIKFKNDWLFKEDIFRTIFIKLKFMCSALNYTVEPFGFSATLKTTANKDEILKTVHKVTDEHNDIIESVHISEFLNL